MLFAVCKVTLENLIYIVEAIVLNNIGCFTHLRYSMYSSWLFYEYFGSRNG